MTMKELEIVPVGLRYVSVYYVGDSEGGILIDAGDPGKEGAILQQLAEHGVQPEDVRCIVITHAHSDHYGSLAALKKATGAQVLASRVSAGFMREGKSEPVVPQIFLSKLMFGLMNGLGKITGGRNNMFDPALTPVAADIVVDDDFDLREFGVNGKVISTPGHTLGSLSIYLNSGEMITGDTFFMLGRSTFMPLFQDRALIKESLKKILDLKPRMIYPSHGKPCGVETAQRLYDRQFREKTV